LELSKLDHHNLKLKVHEWESFQQGFFFHLGVTHLCPQKSE